MEMLKKLPREVQVLLGGSLLYLIFSFFDWQQVSFGPVTAGITEWHGVGIIAGLLAIALLLWEAARLFQVTVPLGTLTPGLVSVALALLLLLFTVITFLTHNEARHWPSWIGLLLSIVIAAAAFARARTEGVQMPDVSAMANRTGGSQSTGASSTAPTTTTTSEPGVAPQSPSEPPPSGPGAVGDPGA
jgi:hypothetical protein